MSMVTGSVPASSSCSVPTPWEKIEYRYSNYTNLDFSDEFDIDNFRSEDFDTEIDLDRHQVVVGVGFRF